MENLEDFIAKYDYFNKSDYSYFADRFVSKGNLGSSVPQYVPDVETVDEISDMVSDFFSLPNNVRMQNEAQMLEHINKFSSNVISYFDNVKYIDDNVYSELSRSIVTKGGKNIPAYRYILEKTYALYGDNKDIIDDDIEKLAKVGVKKFKLCKKELRAIKKHWTPKGRKKVENPETIINTFCKRVDHRYKKFNETNQTYYSLLNTYLDLIEHKNPTDTSDSDTVIDRLIALTDVEQKLRTFEQHINDREYGSVRVSRDVKAFYENKVRVILKDSRKANRRLFDEILDSYLLDSKNELADITKLMRAPLENYYKIEKLLKNSTVGNIKKISANIGVSISDRIKPTLTKIANYRKTLMKYENFVKDYNVSKKLVERLDPKTSDKFIDGVLDASKGLLSIETKFSRTKSELEPLYEQIEKKLKDHIAKISTILHDALLLDDIKIADISKFGKSLDRLQKKYTNLISSKDGPVANVFRDESKIVAIKKELSKYSLFKEIFSNLTSSVEVYKLMAVDELYDKYNEIQKEHESCTCRLEDFHDDYKAIVTKRIEYINESFAKYANVQITNVYSYIEDVLNSDKEVKIKAAQIGSKLKSLEELVTLDIIEENNIKKYEDYLAKHKKLQRAKDSLTTKLKKSFLTNPITKKLIPSKFLVSGDAKITYVPDTNVLVQDPRAIYNFEEHNVVVSFECHLELDRLKENPKKRHIRSEVQAAISEIASWIDSAKDTNADVYGQKITAGITINKYGGTLRATGPMMYRPITSLFKKQMVYKNINPMDYYIIQQALLLQKKGENVVLVSNDNNIRIGAESMGLQAQPYKRDMISTEIDDLFMGYRELDVTTDVINKFKTTGELFLDLPNLVNNEVLVLKPKNDPSKQYLIRYCEDKFTPINSNQSLMGGKIRPRNLEQKLMIEALNNPDFDVVIFSGPAGTGKDFLPLAKGISDSRDELYREMLATRVFAAIDDVGFLPGNIQDKSRPWMDFIPGNLEEIARILGVKEKDFFDEVYSKHLSFKPINYMRGTTISNRFVLISEAQNLTPQQMKLLITRIGEGTTVVVNGDLDQIEESTRLNPYNCGLSHLIERFTGSPNVMNLRLKDARRSLVSRMGVELL